VWLSVLLSLSLPPLCVVLPLWAWSGLLPCLPFGCLSSASGDRLPCLCCIEVGRVSCYSGLVVITCALWAFWLPLVVAVVLVVRCSFVASGVVNGLCVRSALVAGLLPLWLPRCLLWRWPWGLFPSLLTIQGGRLSCRLYGIAGLFGGCPVWVPRFCLWWFLRSVRVVPRSFLLPLVLVVGRCLGVGSFFGRWFGCLWWCLWCPFRIAPAAVPFVGVWSGCASCGRVWSGCGVWVSGVVIYCTRRKILHFAPVFNL
jgi:hypothetical protein